MSSRRYTTSTDSILHKTGCCPGDGFEQCLSEKQTFFLYLSIVIPNIDLIYVIWSLYRKGINKDILSYHNQISPFQPHPCGQDCLFHPVGGFIDPDMFLSYYKPRENYLISLEMIGHTWFICQFKRSREDLEESPTYFDTLINEGKLKLTKLRKKRVLEQAIKYLSEEKYNLTIDQIMRYLLSLYNMYKDTKVLHGYPLAIDRAGKLCRFE